MTDAACSDTQTDIRTDGRAERSTLQTLSINYRKLYRASQPAGGVKTSALSQTALQAARREL